jgi:hypothetical protein
MISTEWLITLIAALGLRWQESCGDPALFCYRMGWEFLVPLHGPPNRNNAAPCSIPSHTCCTLSTTSKA